MTTPDVPTEPPEIDSSAVGAFADRIAMATVAGLELVTIELGKRLGLYQALAAGAGTVAELADRSRVDHRYCREWLEQQATAGILTVDVEPEEGDPASRVFGLPAAHAVALLDPDSLAFVAPLTAFPVGAAGMIDQLVAAYRTGGGIAFADYGEWIRTAQEEINRPQFLNLLATEWFPAMPDVVRRLQTGPSRVADIGCGGGWSSIAIATGYPQATVFGFDTDEASIEAARRNAADAGVAGRTQFSTADAVTGGGSYDLVCCFEALHDMSDPVGALAAMRRMAGDDGAVLVVDERTADALTANDPDPVQRLLYAVSVLHCLPVGRNEQPSAATGAVMRTATLEHYAAEAGFGSVEVLPVDHESFRLYRLHS